MGKYPKTILFARRLSVFYLLIGVFSVFFGVFYFKYIPANQSELNSRGFRILNQLARNLQARDTTLEGNFQNLNVWMDQVGSKDERKIHLNEGAGVEQQIQSHVPFTTDPTTDTTGKVRPQQRQDSVRNDPREGWSLVFRMQGNQRAVVRIGDFVGPVLAARDDLFDSYVLLEAPRDSSRRMSLLYLQKEFSPADRISADSALALEKNTDMASDRKSVV